MPCERPIPPDDGLDGSGATGHVTLLIGFWGLARLIAKRSPRLLLPFSGKGVRPTSLLGEGAVFSLQVGISFGRRLPED